MAAALSSTARPSRNEGASMSTPAGQGFSPSTAPARESSTTGRIRHVLSALVQNQPGVLAQVSGMFASRGFNIDSLAVGETEAPRLSRITVTVKGHDISREDYVERDLMLIKLKVPAAERPEIQALVQIFRGRIVDVSPEEL